MTNAKPTITVEECKALLACPEWSQRRIVKTYAISYKKVADIAHGTYEEKTKGRKIKFNEEHRNYVVECAYLVPSDSAERISIKFSNRFFPLTISVQMVRNIIKDNGFKYLNARKIQNLNEVQITVRFNYACSIFNTFEEDDEFWKKLVFSDESRFCAVSDGAKKVWRRVDDFRPEVCVTQEKFSVSAMVWGAIGFNYKSELLFIDGKLDSEKYIQLLETNGIFESCKEAIGDDFIFQQDEAPCHTAHDTIDWLHRIANVRLLLGWPPNSPDLSPIEMLWGAIKCRLCHYKEFPKTYEELHDAIKKEWDSFDQESINSLVISFRNRLKMCKDCGGKSISHYLSAHLTAVPEDDVVQEAHLPPIFNPGDDLMLMEEFHKDGRKWKKIAAKMGGTYSPVLVKYRVLLLNAIEKLNNGKPVNIENENALDLSDDKSNLTFESFICFIIVDILKQRRMINKHPKKEEK